MHLYSHFQKPLQYKHLSSFCIITLVLLRQWREMYQVWVPIGKDTEFLCIFWNCEATVKIEDRYQFVLSTWMSTLHLILDEQSTKILSKKLLHFREIQWGIYNTSSLKCNGTHLNKQCNIYEIQNLRQFKTIQSCALY